MNWKRIALTTAVAGTLAAAPFADADARHRRGGPGPGIVPFIAGAAVLGTAAALATAPRYYYPPPAYYPSPAYYPPPAPYYHAPAYYSWPGYYRPY
jgi:hypothetical protein